MLKIYFRTAWRSLVKRKFYTLVNLSGLAMAMCCCTLIYVYTNYHLGFDSYHKNAGKIFRLVYELHLDKTEYDKGASIAMLNSLKTEMPQVEQGAIAISDQSLVIATESRQRFKEEHVTFAGSDWFRLFDYQWMKGSPARLDEPNTAVLTQKLAEKYFGSSDPIDRILLINNQQVKVAGVLADRPFNTDLKADIYLSFSSFRSLLPTIEASYFTYWGSLSSKNSAFIALKNVNQRAAVEKELERMVPLHMGAGSEKYYKFKLLPLREMHFDAHYEGTVQKSLLVILAAIGTLIMLIAGINYINLVIAQQSRRNIEIGTRKVLGGSAWHLFLQFITESILVSVFSAILAGILVLALMPVVNRVLFSEEPLYILSYTRIALFLGSLSLLAAFGTGVYPAWLLSRINVSKALKNETWNSRTGNGRRTLVVVQNIVSQSLVAGTLIIILQVHFLRNTDKGFNREWVVMVPTENTTDLQKQQLRQSLQSMSEVKSFSFCHRAPSSNSQRGATVQFNERPEWETWPARFAIGDTAYCRTFGLQVVTGRNIRTNHALPEFLVNEKMADMLRAGKRENVLGKTLMAGDIKGVIVGIVKDFNVRSLLEPIEPTVLLESPQQQTSIGIKLSGNHTPAALDRLQQAYQQVFPQQVFTYQFVDEQIAALYKKETLQQKLIQAAALVAIMISSLGLLGLLSLMILQRTKEIGIRKVLGASVSEVSLLLSKDFLKLTLIALAIAAPLTWWMMTQWLQNFAYRIEIHWWMFAASGSLALLVSILTVGVQAVKAATANPVKSLRTE